jgi:iron complex outermembrane receptor protein
MPASNSLGRAALRGLLMMSACTMAMPAMAMSQTTHVFNIPAQSVAGALQAFGKQSGKQIVFPYDGAASRTAPAIMGAYADDDVLARLAQAGHLVVLSNNGQTIALGQSVARITNAAALVEAPASAAEPAPAAAPKPARDVEHDIVVTGSRIISNGNNSPTPLTVASAEALLTNKPGTLHETLNQLPIFAGSRGQTANPSINGGIGGGNGAAGQLNLRNVGALRNLVLFDGHRIPPTLFNGTVDMDMIPQDVIKRVEMVTGGVGAIYGSDAVTGVVNFITDTKLEGLKTHAQYGVSSRGDGNAMEIGATYGHNILEGRGHIIVSYQFHDDKGITKRTSRPWAVEASAGGNGSAATPYYTVLGARSVSSTFGGLIGNGALKNYNFASDGTLSALNSGTAVGNGSVRVGGDGIYNDPSLKAPLRSHQIYGRLDYDISDTIHASLVGAGNFKLNKLYSGWANFAGMTISATNPYLSTATQAQLASAGYSSFSLSKNFLDYDSRYNPEPRTDQYFIDATLTGKLGRFDWEMAANYGSSKLHVDVKNNINREHLFAALEATTNASGKIVCASLAIRPDCVALNPFGPTAASADAMRYIFQTTHWDALTTMKDVSGHISGPIFTLPAGEVKAALSAEWRSVGYHSASDHPPELFADCTGIVNNCVSSGAARSLMYANTLPNRSQIGQNVGEAAVELSVPLLKNAAFARSLSLDMAGRYTNYDTSGSYGSWKVGADWHINDDLRIRAAISTDIRAPNLFDILTPTFSVPLTASDPLRGNITSTTIPSINFATPSLKAEIGHTKTMGLVFTPQAIPGFSLSVDYWDIKINNAIQTIQGWSGRVLAACRNWIQGGGAAADNLGCMLQSRDASLTRGAGDYSYNSSATASNLTALYGSNFNLGYIATHGMDIEANYRTRLANRPINLRLLATYQPHLRFNYGALGLSEDDVAGYASGGATETLPTPKWRATAFLGFSPLDNLAVDLSYRWRSAMGVDATAGVNWADRIRSYGVTNLNLSYTLPMKASRQAQVFLNVSNLFDQAPAILPTTGTPGGGYPWILSDDWIGRYFTFGVRSKF